MKTWIQGFNYVLVNILKGLISSEKKIWGPGSAGLDYTNKVCACVEYLWDLWCDVTLELVYHGGHHGQHLGLPEHHG